MFQLVITPSMYTISATVSYMEREMQRSEVETVFANRIAENDPYS